MVASLTLQCNLIWNDVMCRFSARPSPSLSSHIGGRPGSFIQGQQVRRRPAKPRLPRPHSFEPHANQHRRPPARPGRCRAVPAELDMAGRAVSPLPCLCPHTQGQSRIHTEGGPGQRCHQGWRVTRRLWEHWAPRSRFTATRGWRHP